VLVKRLEGFQGLLGAVSLRVAPAGSQAKELRGWPVLESPERVRREVRSV
jgi:hypothetical protein